MTAKKDIRRLLGTERCRIKHTNSTGYVFVLYRNPEFTNLPEIRLPPTEENPEGQPGPAVVPPTDPGPPNATTHAQTVTWEYNKANYENYEIVLEWVRESIRYSFPNGNVLLSQENNSGILTQDPRDLFDFLWRTKASREDKDREIKKANKDMDENYDPNDDITTYLEKKQDERYRLLELA